MSEAFSLILWGTIITIFNINIGWLNLFPNFMGYILIAIGLSNIFAISVKNANNAKKAGDLAWILAAYSLFMLLAGDAFEGALASVLSSAFMTVDMIMCYFALSTAVNESNGEAIYKWQRNYLIAATIAIASSCFALVVPAILWVTIIFSFASKIYFIYLCQVIKKQMIL